MYTTEEKKQFDKILIHFNKILEENDTILRMYMSILQLIQLISVMETDIMRRMEIPVT